MPAIETVRRQSIAGLTAEFTARLLHLAAPQPFPLALTGGGSAAAFYDALAAAGPPPGIEFYWSDERVVSPDDADSNYRLARQHLLDPARIAPGRIHRVETELGGDAAAAAYAAQARQVGRFPLILLGLGEDGHTASLFPGRDPFADDPLLVRAVAGTAAHPHERVTFTPALLNAAQRIWWLVTGENKRWALRQLLERTATPTQVPALCVDPARTAVTVFTNLEP